MSRSEEGNDLSSRRLVMKFGGTSVGSAAAIRQAAEIVRSSRQEWQDVLVVLSALSGVTNLLLDSALKSAVGQGSVGPDAMAALRSRHLSVLEEVLPEGPGREEVATEIEELTTEFGNLCGAISVLGEATPRALDAVASIGERLSVRLFTAYLREEGVEAEFVESTRLIRSDAQFQAAHPDLDQTRTQTRALVTPIFRRGRVAVATGFLAATEDGITTTLGRGGSDYSAAILAAAVDADQLWIWTDVDGVMTADPRIVEEARTIPSLSYRELAELAYFGAKVLHPMTIRPVVEAGIGLTIKNTFSPDSAGTELVSRNRDARQVVKAVTSIPNQSLITIEGRGMLGVPGVAARAFSAVAATGTNVILISQASSEQSISFAVPADRSQVVVSALERAFRSEIENRDIDRIWSAERVVIVTVVGSGMRHTPGVAGRVFSALGDREVNVVAIAQGSSEVAISLVVEEADMEEAVRILHQLIS